MKKQIFGFMLLFLIVLTVTVNAQSSKKTVANILYNQNVEYKSIIATKDTIEIWEDLSLFQPDAAEMMIYSSFLDYANNIFKKVKNIQKVRAVGFMPQTKRDKYGNLKSKKNEPIIQIGISRKSIKKVNWQYYKKLKDRANIMPASAWVATAKFVEGIVDEIWKNPKYYRISGHKKYSRNRYKTHSVKTSSRIKKNTLISVGNITKMSKKLIVTSPAPARANPDPYAKVIAKLKKGKIIKVIGLKGSWYRIDFGWGKAWIHKSVVKEYKG